MSSVKIKKQIAELINNLPNSILAIRMKSSDNLPNMNFTQYLFYLISILSLSEKIKILDKEVNRIEKTLIKNNPKRYDGNDLKSAGDCYNISAKSWEEIIRFEDGYDTAIYDQMVSLQRQIIKVKKLLGKVSK